MLQQQNQPESPDIVCACQAVSSMDEPWDATGAISLRDLREVVLRGPRRGRSRLFSRNQLFDLGNREGNLGDLRHNFGIADFHDKSLSRGQNFSRRTQEERAKSLFKLFGTRLCLSAIVLALCRTRHPFAVSDQRVVLNRRSS